MIALAALAALIVGALIAGNGLVSCGNQQAAPAAVSRPVTAAEAQRLAGVRLANYTVGHVGIQVTIGSGASAVHMTGWVDWRQPLIYLNSVGVKAGPSDGMIQAIPGVVAVRPGRYTPAASGTGKDAQYDPYPAPPVAAPPTGWQIRPLQPGSSIDTMITLLFAMRAAATDSAAQISSIGTKLVGTDEIAGDPVDIIDGAAVPPPAATPSAATPSAATPSTATSSSAAPTPSASGLPFAAQGGQVRYWVDAQSHVLRVEALINPTTTLEIDFDRTDSTVPSAIELLGGPVNTPTKLTSKQAKLLAGMRLADFTSGGGTITLAVPVSQDELYSATGWLDWHRAALYVTIRNNKTSSPDETLRADAAGITLHGSLDSTSSAPIATAENKPLLAPSLHPPKTGWKRSTWASQADKYGEPDLDAILNELLAMSSVAADDPAQLKTVASRLRSDSVNGVPVTVFEIRQANEAKIPPGYGRLRFWVDAHGLLRRLEIRTRGGAFGYVTMTPGAVPKLPDPVKAPPATK